jgi:hypothetical protein
MDLLQHAVKKVVSLRSHAITNVFPTENEAELRLTRSAELLVAHLHKSLAHGMWAGLGLWTALQTLERLREEPDAAAFASIFELVVSIKTSFPKAPEEVKTRIFLRSALNRRFLLTCVELLQTRYYEILASYFMDYALIMRGPAEASSPWVSFVSIIAPVAGPPLSTFIGSPSGRSAFGSGDGVAFELSVYVEAIDADPPYNQSMKLFVGGLGDAPDLPGEHRKDPPNRPHAPAGGPHSAGCEGNASQVEEGNPPPREGPPPRAVKTKTVIKKVIKRIVVKKKVPTSAAGSAQQDLESDAGSIALHSDDEVPAETPNQPSAVEPYQSAVAADPSRTAAAEQTVEAVVETLEATLCSTAERELAARLQVQQLMEVPTSSHSDPNARAEECDSCSTAVGGYGAEAATSTAVQQAVEMALARVDRLVRERQMILMGMIEEEERRIMELLDTGQPRHVLTTVKIQE